ncbi:cyclic nucleotide-binding domain-containing protein, partial [Xanthomonas citri]
MSPGNTTVVTTTVRNATPSLALDAGTIERFLAHSHRRRYPTRTDVFRPGDPAGTLYYVISGSVSIIAEEDDDRELVLGYFGSGEFVGEMGLFIESDTREVILRTRTQCE